MPQKKMGRPVSPDSKHTMFRVRLDDTSLAKLEECAKELHTTMSDIVRKGIDRIHDDLNKK
ncbi:ribbon-helix-helix domain-containing protein [Anaeromassilibacillus senegalensis]|uniref:CopG family transcriptional regulator n=1 Tax=Anaeromassilibacillus senegalensis TaxID=1673717 RepID=UPI000680068C|nr:CopG family transcriptional regulator [Anaeromassilibacillus senegalensis]